MYRIYLSPSNQPANKYCVGNTNEKVEMEAIAKKIKEILDEEYNCEAVMATFYLNVDSAGRPKEAKDKGCHIYLAIHSNAGGGGKASGAVAFFHPESYNGKLLAAKVVKELNAICPIQSNRSIPVESGMKQFNGIGYGEIRNPAKIGLASVLVETDFHDNPKTAQWIIDSKDEIARAYANAIVKTFNISKKSPSQEKLAKKYYKVQVGAYSNKSNAEAMLKRLKIAGFVGFIKYE
jgi:N-acetylmuramoyl-L-alanine amidase